MKLLSFSFAVATVFLFGTLATAAPVVLNNGFEASSNGYPGQGPITDWVRGGTSSGTNSSGQPFHAETGAPIPFDAQVGLIQGTGDISQSVSGFETGKNYVVRYYENSRGNSATKPNTFATLGGTTVVANHDVETTTAAYQRVISTALFNYTGTDGGSATLAYTNTSPATDGSNDNTALFDNFAIGEATQPFDASFEFRSIAAGTSEFTNVPNDYTFSNAGLARSGSSYMGGLTAPDGDQVAFLQQTGTVSQTIAGFADDTSYTLTYFDARRPSSVGSNDEGMFDYRVLLDGDEIARFTLSADQGFQERQLNFLAEAGFTHTLTFEGLNSFGGNNSFLFDALQVSLTPPIPEPNSLVLLGCGILGLTLSRRRRSWKR